MYPIHMTDKNKILIVDDSASERMLLKAFVGHAFSHECLFAENGAVALDLLAKENINDIAVILLDLNMPVMGGMETLKRLVKRYPKIPVIIITGDERAEKSADAMRIGAFDFVNKAEQRDLLIKSIGNALKIQEEASHGDVQEGQGFKSIIGYDNGLKTVVSHAAKAAVSLIPVLITGETGTGKEVLARAIHEESHRSDKPFVAINCGAIPATLLESILFGHKKGAFTGADEEELGKFREADGGTIFLDEIGELPYESQSKLLRVLQQKEVQPVGGGKPVPVDVRVISATNRDLGDEVQSASFRQDLLYRLNVFTIELPALRNRKQDIPNIVAYFMRIYAEIDNHDGEKNISNAAQKTLQEYSWPGNVRELESVVRQSLITSHEDTLYAEDFARLLNVLPKKGKSDQGDAAHFVEGGYYVSILEEDGSLKSLEQVEQEILLQAIKHNKYNFTKTARLLGIAKSTLYRKINKIES